jgi:outer membrane murein-binding lipoprotein Lpp
VITLVVVLPIAVVMIAGCEGTETRDQVDDTVEELAGKKHGDRMKAMKEDLDQIQSQQADRLKQLDDAQ